MRRTSSAFSLYELTESRVTMTVLVSAVVLSALRLRGSDFDSLIAEPGVWIHQPWTLVTSTLLHVSWWHLVFNVYWIAIFGVAVESAMGSLATGGLFLLFAVTSSLPQVVLGGSGIGLSGVGYGLFGFLLTMNRWDSRFRGCLDSRTTVLFIGWFFVCIAMTVSGTMAVGNWAHGAGLVIGAATGWAMADTSKSVVVRALPLFFALSAIGFACTVFSTRLGGRDARAAVLIDKGRHMAQGGDNRGAEAVFTAALLVDAGDWETWWSLGEARWRLGEYDQALDALGKAASLHSLAPEQWDFLVKAREWYRKSGRHHASK